MELVDSRGRPLRADKAIMASRMSGPSVVGTRSILSGHPWQGLDPTRLTTILRNAEQGSPVQYLELAEEIEEKDPHYQSVLSTRKLAVAQIPIRVEPANDSAEAKADAALVNEWVENEDLEDQLVDMLDAIGKGYSFSEIVWDTSTATWLPGEIAWSDPRFFEFDKVDGTTPLLIMDGGMPEPLENCKFIHHVHKAKSGLKIRGGLARMAAWGLMFKNYAMKDWVQFLELYGVPMRVGRYDSGAHEDDIRKLMRAVSQVGADATAVYPRTMDIEFIDGKQGTSPNDLWRSLAEYIDEQNSKLVLGQTSSSDAKAGGLGSGQANLHGDVRDDIKRSDAKRIAKTLNASVVRWIVQLNRGGRRAYPKLVIEEPDAVDVQSTGEAARTFISMGGEVSKSKLRDMLGLPSPENDEDILRAPQPSPELDPEKTAQDGLRGQKGPQLPKKRSTDLLDSSYGPESARQATASALDGEPPAPDAIDDVVDEALGDWTEMVDALLEPIADMIGEASSLADAQKRLAGQLERMDESQFATMMEQLGFATALAGMVDAKAESDAIKGSA